MTDNPHDALFQYVFSSVEHAAPALRSMLPASLVEKIDFSTLALAPGHFVDERLDGRRSDLLFSVEIAGRDAFVYVLFEHQSYVDRWLLLRILEYMVRIWRSHLASFPKTKRLPLIVPLVLHHSRTGWRAARRFEELVDVTASHRDALELVPRFGIVLDDISGVEDAELARRAMTSLGRLSLYLLRRARSPEELLAGLGRWAEALVDVANAPNGGAAIVAVMEYLRSISKREDGDVAMAVREVVGESVYDRIFRAGERLEQRGEQRGLQQGLQEGRREVLLRLLVQRFGELSESTQAVLDSATTDQLDAITERILTAPTLADVLGQPPKASGKTKGRAAPKPKQRSPR